MTILNTLFVALLTSVITFLGIYLAGTALLNKAHNIALDFADNLKQITPQNKATEDNLTPDVRAFLANMFSVDPNNIEVVDASKISKKDFILNDADLKNKINRLKTDKKYLKQQLNKAIVDEDYHYANYLKEQISKLENTPPASEK